MATAGAFNDPMNIAVDSSDNVYVANSNTNQILGIAPGSSTATAITTPSALNGPYGVAVDADGELYVAEGGNSQVAKLTSVP